MPNWFDGEDRDDGNKESKDRKILPSLSPFEEEEPEPAKVKRPVLLKQPETEPTTKEAKAGPVDPQEEDSEEDTELLTTEERRRRVFEYSLRSMPVMTMAKILKVHRNTITKDLQAIQEEMKQRVVNADPAILIGEHLQVLRELEIMALFEYHSMPDEAVYVEIEGADGVPERKRSIAKSHAQNRAKFMDVLLRSRLAAAELQMKTGVMPKVPEQLDLGLMKVNGADIRTMSPEALRVAREEYLQKLALRAGATGLLPPATDKEKK